MTHDCLRPSLYRDPTLVEFNSELAAKTRAVHSLIAALVHYLHSQFCNHGFHSAQQRLRILLPGRYG
jgi:hypothetical protein